MASFNNGHKGPNVSEFIANLNAIPSAQDLSQSQDNFKFDDELAIFTNTQFFDFDLGQDADFQPSNVPFEPLPAAEPAAPAGDNKGVDFVPGDFTFPDFGYHASNGYPAEAGPTVQNSHPVYPPSSSGGSPTSGLVSSHAGEKRKSDALADAQYGGSFEEVSRLAAEEDKRRRNTAASARFRIKKKQREQALEKSAKEMSDKVAALEGRINQLETENKWLKSLVMEKNESKDDIAALYKKFSQEISERKGERKGDERKDGVGTVKA